MIDPNKSPLLERVAAFFAVATVTNLFIAQLLPYASSYFHITLGEADRTMVSQVQSAVINLAMLLAGYFWGTTSGRSKMEDSVNKLATAAAGSPTVATVSTPEVDIPLKDGDTATVTAGPPKGE